MINNCENNGVYVLSNLETNDFYIGSTIDVYRRVNDHFRDLDLNRHKNWKFQRSYNKNSNFHCNFVHFETRQLALDFEDLMIKKFKNHKHLLNICLDVEQPRLGILASDETKIKQSISAKKFYLNGGKNPMDGRKHTKDSLIKIKNAAKKQFESKEMRQLHRNLAIKRWNNPIYREQHKTSLIIALSKPEIKHKTSISAKKRWTSKIERLKQSKMAINRFKDPNQRKICSNGGKKTWSDPNYRLKVCKGIKINGIVYESVCHAGRILNINPATVRLRVKSHSEQFRDWNYL